MALPRRLRSVGSSDSRVTRVKGVSEQERRGFPCPPEICKHRDLGLESFDPEDEADRRELQPDGRR